MANQHLQFATVPTDSNSITKALGISDERHEAINKATSISVERSETISAALADISGNVETPAELAFTAYNLGRSMAEANKNPVSQLFESLTSRFNGASVQIISSTGECQCPNCKARREKEKSSQPEQPVNDEAGH